MTNACSMEGMERHSELTECVAKVIGPRAHVRGERLAIDQLHTQEPCSRLGVMNELVYAAKVAVGKRPHRPPAAFESIDQVGVKIRQDFKRDPTSQRSIEGFEDLPRATRGN